MVAQDEGAAPLLPAASTVSKGAVGGEAAGSRGPFAAGDGNGDDGGGGDGDGVALVAMHAVERGDAGVALPRHRVVDAAKDTAVELVGTGAQPPAHPHAHPTTPAQSPSARRRAVVRAWVFFMALSLHGVFDGLSVGSEDGVKGFTSILVAVLSHKLFDGLSLGCALYPAHLPPRHRWALLVVCALTTPVGIAVGLAAEAVVASTQVRLVNGVVLGMASGSFAFISLLELLPSSLADGRLIKTKLACFVAGFAGMAALAGVA